MTIKSLLVVCILLNKGFASKYAPQPMYLNAQAGLEQYGHEHNDVNADEQDAEKFLALCILSRHVRLANVPSHTHGCFRVQQDTGYTR